MTRPLWNTLSLANPTQDRTTWLELAHRMTLAERLPLDLIAPDGRRLHCAGEARATLRFKTWPALWHFFNRDQLGLFEAYLDFAVELEHGGGDEAAALLAVVGVIDERWRDLRWLTAAMHSSRHVWQRNTAARRAKLAVHYSVPAEFWLSFMDEEYPIYSHYLFEEDEDHTAWKRACRRKLDYALSICRLQEGQHLLNIGEGWAGMLTYAGRRGLRVSSVTLNEESYRAALHKRDQEQLGERCSLVQTDFYHYRPDTTFDAITNMGVTEHLTDYDALLAQYARLLKPGGFVYSDFVGITRDLNFAAWCQKHIYPGAAAVYLPRLLKAVEKNGALEIVAIHDDRKSYEKTCEAWARNAEANSELLVSRFGARRYRWLWSYLWMCVYGFRKHTVGITGTRVVLRRR